MMKIGGDPDEISTEVFEMGKISERLPSVNAHEIGKRIAGHQRCRE
jgi:hypothetical protein